MAKTQYYTATSVDGYIADADNSLDWLFEADSGRDGSPFESLARTEFVGPTVTVLSGSALESGWSMGVTDVFGPTERHAGWVCQL